MIINRLIFSIRTKQLNNLGYVYELIRAFLVIIKQNRLQNYVIQATNVENAQSNYGGISI